MLVDLTGHQLDWYRLKKRLGEGTFGTVYLADDLRRKREVAIKVVDPATTTQDQFYREVNELVRLRHPHIIPVIGFGVANSIPYIVIEYAPGGSLHTQHPWGTQLPLVTVVSYVTQIAAALQHAHDDQLLHRDVKPDNVLIGATGDVLLGDFGIATLSKTGLVDINQPLPSYRPGGTPYYMAPEQCQGKPEKASDQYALAIMAYQWLVGKPPFYQGQAINIQYQHVYMSVPSLRASVPTLDERVEAVIMKALAKDPNARFVSVEQFALALKEASTTPTIGTRVLVYRGHSTGYIVGVWSPDGRLFATGGATGIIDVWNAATNERIWQRDEFVGSVTSLAWSPDGSRLASGSNDRSVQVWEASGGQLLYTYTGHSSVVRSVAWSPDGSRLASGSLDNTVQVWEASSGRLLYTYSGHSLYVNGVAWSPDGSRLASASADQSMQVWEANSGRLLRTYTDHTSEVTSVAWSPDGLRLASGSWGVVLVWQEG